MGMGEVVNIHKLNTLAPGLYYVLDFMSLRTYNKKLKDLVNEENGKQKLKKLLIQLLDSEEVAEFIIKKINGT